MDKKPIAETVMTYKEWSRLYKKRKRRSELKEDIALIGIFLCFLGLGIALFILKEITPYM